MKELEILLSFVRVFVPISRKLRILFRKLNTSAHLCTNSTSKNILLSQMCLLNKTKKQLRNKI